AALAARFRRFHTLAVKDRRTRFWIAPRLDPNRPPQGVVDPFPCPITPPFVVVISDRAPMRKVFGEHFPLAARPRQIEERIDHLPHVDAPWRAWPRSPRHQRLQEFPLLVRQIGRVPLSWF